jgi:hypothetical protein
MIMNYNSNDVDQKSMYKKQGFLLKLHAYMALNQDNDNKNELVLMKNHHDVRNNNQLIVNMYTDVEKYL